MIQTTWLRLFCLLLGATLLISGCASLDKAASLHRQGKDEQALKMAEKYLDEDEDEAVRLQAIELIADIGGSRAGAVLTPLLDDKSIPVKNTAIDAMGKIRYEPSVPKIIDIALDASGDTLESAATAIRKIGQPAIDRLVQRYARTENPVDQERYKKVMLAVGPVVVPAITETMAGKSYFENRTNFEILIAFKSPQVADWLLKEIDNDEIADSVVEGLSKLGSDAVAPVLEMLEEMPANENERTVKVKERLITVLGNLKAKKAVDTLEELTKDPSNRVRRAADFALRKIRGF